MKTLIVILLSIISAQANARSKPKMATEPDQIISTRSAHELLSLTSKDTQPSDFMGRWKLTLYASIRGTDDSYSGYMNKSGLLNRIDRSQFIIELTTIENDWMPSSERTEYQLREINKMYSGQINLTRPKFYDGRMIFNRSEHSLAAKCGDVECRKVRESLLYNKEYNLDEYKIGKSVKVFTGEYGSWTGKSKFRTYKITHYEPVEKIDYTGTHEYIRSITNNVRDSNASQTVTCQLHIENNKRMLCTYFASTKSGDYIYKNAYVLGFEKIQ